jgi:hypothetical protein
LRPSGEVGVERQAPLVAVEVAEEPAAEAAQPARAVAVDRLDLDHLGAQVGEDHAARRPRMVWVSSTTRMPLRGGVILMPLNGTRYGSLTSVIPSGARDLYRYSKGRSGVALG